MSAEPNAVTASAVNPALLADLDKAAQAGDTFSRADMPAQQQGPAVVGSPPDPAMAGMLTGALVVTFNLLAKQRGDHWALDADTAGEAGNAYAAVIQKYFPAFQGGPEFTAIMVTVALVVPRVMIDKANAAAEAAKRADDGAQPE